MEGHRQSRDAGPTDSRGKNPSRRVVTSRELLGGLRELIIEHAGEEYKLRITSKDKLILTK